MNLLIWGIYLVVFCLPLYLVRFSILNIPTNVLELMVGILFILWLIKGGFKKFKKLLASNYSLLIATILILIGDSLTTALSWDLRTSAGIWKSWFVVPLVFFIILITTIKSKQIKGVFWAFILSVFIVAVISLIQWNFDSLGRLQGIYTSPNYLAMYLAPGLVVLGCYLFTFFAPQLRGSGIGLRRIFLVSSFCVVLIVIFLQNQLALCRCRLCLYHKTPLIF